MTAMMTASPGTAGSAGTADSTWVEFEFKARCPKCPWKAKATSWETLGWSMDAHEEQTGHKTRGVKV